MQILKNNTQQLLYVHITLDKIWKVNSTAIQ